MGIINIITRNINIEREGGDVFFMTMKRGSSHRWAYNGRWYERKVAPGKWKINYVATKRQRPRPGVPRGSRYHWKINAHQYAVKTANGRYQTRMVGTKRLVRANVKKRRKGR